MTQRKSLAEIHESDCSLLHNNGGCDCDQPGADLGAKADAVLADFQLQERAREIANELRRSHHVVARDTIAFLLGGPTALREATDSRKLDRRSRTRAEGKIAGKLMELRMHNGDDSDAFERMKLRRAVAAELAKGTGR